MQHSVEPDGRVFILRLGGGLRRTEGVVELLLEARYGAVGV